MRERAVKSSIADALFALRAWSAVAMLACATTCARADSSVKQDAKQVGHEVGTAVREVGHEAKKVGRAIKDKTKEGVQAVKEGGKEFKRAVKGESSADSHHD